MKIILQGVDDCSPLKKTAEVERLIAATQAKGSADGTFLGVDGRLVPEDVNARYMGIEERSTKRLEDIMEYLDGVKIKAKVEVPGGRSRIVVVGDQETFNLVHKALKQVPTKYGWAIPWGEAWHLLEHTFDVLYQK